MVGVVKRVVARYHRGIPLDDAREDFHKHIIDGREVVLVCTRCESPRVRNNHLSSDLLDSVPQSKYTCLDCSADYTELSTLKIIEQQEFESEIIQQNQSEY